MPRYETIVTAFVASPSDVQAERDALEEVVSDLNNTWSKTLGIRLELVRWETHVFPGIGSDPQAIINEQIGDDYDIFLGILWTRFGTPTPRAGSGTAEEFERAYGRFTEQPTNVKVMIYFKDAPVAPSQIDLRQLAAVKDFRERVIDAGCLYWSYSTLEEFKKLLTIHLGRQVQEFCKQPASGKDLRENHSGLARTAIETTLRVDVTDSADVEEEEGFLDLIEKGTESFLLTTEVGHRLAGIIEGYGQKMGDYAQQIEALGQLVQPPDVKRAKQIVNHAADAMGLLTKQLEAEIPIFRQSYSTAMDAYGKAAVLLTDFNTDNSEEIEQALQTVRSLKETLINARDSLALFREVIQRLPRVTTQFNRAKHRCLEVTGDLDTEMVTGVNLTAETEQLMESVLESIRQDLI